MQDRFLLLVLAATMFAGPNTVRSQTELSHTEVAERYQSLADQPFPEFRNDLFG